MSNEDAPPDVSPFLSQLMQSLSIPAGVVQLSTSAAAQSAVQTAFKGLLQQRHGISQTLINKVFRLKPTAASNLDVQVASRHPPNRLTCERFQPVTPSTINQPAH
jgi:hypothetical protein